MSWFIREVLPRIAQLAGNEAAHLIVVGKNWDTKGIPESDHVTYAGYVTDTQLSRFYNSRSVFVSPLLNGTGIATKIFNAVVKGIPVVTTPLGLNGFGLTAETARGKIGVQSTADGFAQAVVDLMDNPENWIAQTIAARRYLQKNLHPTVQREIVVYALPRLSHVPSAATTIHRRLPLVFAHWSEHKPNVGDAFEEPVFINPSVAWLGDSAYLLAARRHMGRWSSDGRRRKVWRSELWVGAVSAAQLGGAGARGGTIDLDFVDVHDGLTKGCEYNTKGSFGESSGPEDVRVFRFRREVYAIFWDHPQLPVEQEGNTTCGTQIIQPFLSRVQVRSVAVSDGSGGEFKEKRFMFQRPVPLAVVPSARERISYQMDTVEKNWLPFIQGNTMFATWHVYPQHDVLQINTATGQCKLAHASSSVSVFEPLLRLYARVPRNRNVESSHVDIEDSVSIYGGAAPIEVFEGRDLTRPAYYLAVVHATYDLCCD